MELPLLSSILTVKFGLARHNKCCHSYELRYQILEAVGTLSAITKTNTEEIPIVDNEPQPWPSTSSNVKNID